MKLTVRPGMKSTWGAAIKTMLHSTVQSQTGCHSAKLHMLLKIVHCKF